MALKYKYTSKEQVPVEQAALYVERDGAFVLDVEGDGGKGKVDEFREGFEAMRSGVSGKVILTWEG